MCQGQYLIMNGLNIVLSYGCWMYLVYPLQEFLDCFENNYCDY